MLSEVSGYEIASAYVNRLNEGRYAEIARLFAPDAQLSASDGQRYVGSEIGEFYSQSVSRSGIKVRLGAVCTHGSQCMFLIQRDRDGVFEDRSIDFIELDSLGRIESLRVFLKA
jgi:hypothetical protein